MGFYFCGKYIYTDGDEEEVERGMYVAFFGVFMIRMGMKSGKTILKISSDISLFYTLAEVSLCPIEANWRSIFVVGRQLYQLSRLAYLTRVSSYLVCFTPRGATIQRSGR